MVCGATKDGATCTCTGPHAEHTGMVFTDRPTEVRWDNEDYVAPPKKRTKAEITKDLADKARRIREAEALANAKAALDAPHAYLSGDPASTSVKAAQISAVKNSHRRKQVLAAIVVLGDATDDEVCVRLNDPDQHAGRVASRRLELVEAGWVAPLVADNKMVERRTRTGADAQVWTLTDSAQAMLADLTLPQV